MTTAELRYNEEKEKTAKKREIIIKTFLYCGGRGCLVVRGCVCLVLSWACLFTMGRVFRSRQPTSLFEHSPDG